MCTQCILGMFSTILPLSFPPAPIPCFPVLSSHIAPVVPIRSHSSGHIVNILDFESHKISLLWTMEEWVGAWQYFICRAGLKASVYKLTQQGGLHVPLEFIPLSSWANSCEDVICQHGWYSQYLQGCGEELIQVGEVLNRWSLINYEYVSFFVWI